MTIVTNYSPEWQTPGGGKTGVLWQLMHLWTFIEMKNNLLPKQKCFNFACPQQTAIPVGQVFLALANQFYITRRFAVFNLGCFAALLTPVCLIIAKAMRMLNVLLRRRLMIRMQIKLNVVKKENHRCCMWVRDGWLVKKGGPQRQSETQNTWKNTGWVNGYERQSARNKERESNKWK